MAAIVDFYTTTLKTYEIELYDSALDTWNSVATTVAAVSFPYTEATGDSGDFYRVRDDTDGVGNESPWTPQFLGTPVDPVTCTVSGYIYEADGTALSSAAVAFYIKTDQVISGRHFSVPDWIETATDSDGYWSQDLVQTLTLFVKISSLHIEDEITIPASATSTLDALL